MDRNPQSSLHLPLSSRFVLDHSESLTSYTHSSLPFPSCVATVVRPPSLFAASPLSSVVFSASRGKRTGKRIGPKRDLCVSERSDKQRRVNVRVEDEYIFTFSEITFTDYVSSSYASCHRERGTDSRNSLGRNGAGKLRILSDFSGTS